MNLPQNFLLPSIGPGRHLLPRQVDLPYFTNFHTYTSSNYGEVLALSRPLPLPPHPTSLFDFRLTRFGTSMLFLKLEVDDRYPPVPFQIVTHQCTGLNIKFCSKTDDSSIICSVTVNDTGSTLILKVESNRT